MQYKTSQRLFEIVFEEFKNIFNTQKVHLKKKIIHLVKTLKVFLNVQQD